MRNNKGITLIALVITIIILIILAGITIGLLGGEDGLLAKAKESGRAQKIAEVKEKISLELLNAETEAWLRGETLEVAQRDDIASKYGTVDGDILTTTGDNYEIDLREIYNKTLSTSGSYTALKQAYEAASSDLALATTSQSELAEELQKSTATTDDILTGKKAYVGGSVKDGTMTNNGAIDETLSLNGTYTIPQGYHNGTGTVKQNLTPTTAAKINTTGTTGQQTINLNEAGYYDKVIVDQTAAYNKGKIDGAATGNTVYYLGTGTSFNIKTKCPNVDYTKLTANNFIVEPQNYDSGTVGGFSSAAGRSDWMQAKGTLTKSYNNSTGVLSTTFKIYAKGHSYTSEREGNGWDLATINTNLTTKVYLVVGNIQSV